MVTTLAARVELLEENGWRDNARVVLKLLEQLEDGQNRLTVELHNLSLQLANDKGDVEGRLKVLDGRITEVCRKIGNTGPCKRHDEKLSKIDERVRQHWGEIEKLRKSTDDLDDAISSVDKTGAGAQTEWRTVLWAMIGSGGIVASLLGLLKLAGIL